MNPEEARRQACLKLGNPLPIRDAVWEANRIAWLEDTWRDFRYAARTLAKTPSFTIIAALVMALGIGANTAIYSFLDSLLLRSLPVSDPESLVVLNWYSNASRKDSVMQSMSGSTYDDAEHGSTGGIFPYAVFDLFRENNPAFSEVFAYCHTREVRTMNLAIQGHAYIASGELVSGAYFQGVAVRPEAGRLIIPDDDRTGAAGVVVLSHAFSEKRFGTAANAAGQSIRINNLAFTVVGVAPPGFLASIRPGFPTSICRCIPISCSGPTTLLDFKPRITSTTTITGSKSWRACDRASAGHRRRPRWLRDFSGGWRPPPTRTESAHIFLPWRSRKGQQALTPCAASSRNRCSC